MNADPQILLIGALSLVFVTGILLVMGGGEWAAGRLSQERGLYERVVGKELHKLFMDITPQEFIVYHIGVMVVSVLMGIVLMGSVALGAPIGLLVGAMLPRVYLRRQYSKRMEKLNQQVEEAMIYMSNSFRANPALPDAMQDVCNSIGPPISQEFGVMLKEYRLGTPLDTALINMQKRVPARNLQLAVSALLIGRTVGGNIPKILEDIASTIRESYRLERVIDTQTAQGKMQAWVMGAMPAVVVGMFYLMDPELIRPLFETFYGYLIIAVAVVLNIIGVAMILKIVSIDV